MNMDRSNKKGFFKRQSKNCEEYLSSSGHISEDEEKDKSNILNNAQTFFKSIKDKFRRCKSSIYKSKQKISSYDYQIPSISNSNYANQRNAQIDSSHTDYLAPVPLQVMKNDELLELDIVERRNCFFANMENIVSGQNLKSQINNLGMYGWYWGPMSKEEAEAKLASLPDGSFLVRDSASETYLFTISFRCFGRTLHSRIEYLYGEYSINAEDTFGSIADLIADSMNKSENDIFSYSTWTCLPGPVVPVRLIQPVSRFTHVQSLQHLCRFVIRKYIAINNIKELPLPEILKSYLQEAHF